MAGSSSAKRSVATLTYKAPKYRTPTISFRGQILDFGGSFWHDFARGIFLEKTCCGSFNCRGVRHVSRRRVDVAGVEAQHGENLREVNVAAVVLERG